MRVVRMPVKYSKVHTCDFADERNVESGKEFKVCDFEGIKLGIMICYDREYPENASDVAFAEFVVNVFE